MFRILYIRDRVFINFIHAFRILFLANSVTLKVFVAYQPMTSIQNVL